MLLTAVQLSLPGFDSRRCQIFGVVVGLERGPRGLLRITEKLFERKSSSSRLEKPSSADVGIRCTDHATPSTRKSRH
jgi:hypothetical protein